MISDRPSNHVLLVSFPASTPLASAMSSDIGSLSREASSAGTVTALETRFASLAFSSPTPPNPHSTPRLVSSPSPDPLDPLSIFERANALSMEIKTRADADIKPMCLLLAEDSNLRGLVTELLALLWTIFKDKESDGKSFHSTCTTTPIKPNDMGGSGRTSKKNRFKEWQTPAWIYYCPVTGDIRVQRVHLLIPECFQGSDERAVCTPLTLSTHFSSMSQCMNVSLVVGLPRDPFPINSRRFIQARAFSLLIVPHSSLYHS
jgi:hypothetical protein